MGRKQLLLLLPVISILLLGVVWAILRPEGSSLIPFMGEKTRETTARDESAPLDPSSTLKDVAQAASNEARPRTEDSALGNIDAAERERIIEAREIARVAAEKEAAEKAEQAKQAQPPAPGGTVAEDNRTPEQKALDAERERRINQLRAIKRPPNQSLGNHRPRTRAVKGSKTKPLDEVNARLMQDRRGLFAKYYHFTRNPLEDILDPTKPEFEARTPTITRIDPQVYFPSKAAWSDLPFDLTYFMGVWTGFLVIKEAGDYWFYLGADWTGVVSLHGESILFNDMRDYTEVSTVITLEPGLHPIRIDYMEGKNGSVIDHMGACNFMWVPEGQAKPVPVPPEMLMLPEELWSNNAPIITSLSRYEGEIGDEITIKGQNLSSKEEDTSANKITTVQFSGQPAAILEESDSSLRVRVPVGACSGKVIVTRGDPIMIAVPATSIYTGPRSIPSNSVDFTVTTQFGLMASWHNLQGWSKYDFVDELTHEPDLVRLERDFMFANRSEIDLPFRDNPLACRWDGKLGIPAGFVAEGTVVLLRFRADGRLRVRLGEHTKSTDAPVGAATQTTIDFEVSNHLEHYLPLSLDWTSETGAASVKVLAAVKALEPPPIGMSQPIEWIETDALPSHLFFPPVVPPQPPKILSAKAVLAEGESAPVLPFDVTTTRPSIREGQLFEFIMFTHGSPDVPAVVSVDGKPVEYTTEWEATYENGMREQRCRALLPSGLGDGRMMVRHSIVTGEPYYIDVLNKGLIAYYYDLPNPGGYTQMPDLEPLPAFKVRKDPWVNFENSNDFDLPFPAETFAVEWLGALIIEREGFYRFTGRSDDGIIMWLDDDVVLIDDNLHYQRERTGDWVFMVPGTYKFRMQFFENNVHEVCVLSWDARDDKDDAASEFLPRQIIPKRHFTWDDHPPLPSKVSTGKRTDGSDPE